MSRYIRTSVWIMATLLIVWMPAIPVSAQQHDAWYYESLKRNKRSWTQEDKQVAEKLRALEKRFGKKPNIIYILADDVGWGEPGCYMGG